VGDADTIGYRQALYLAFLGLSVLGTIVAGVVAYRRGWRVALAVLAVYSLAIFAAVPANPDPVTMPADIVTPFRLLSVLGLCVFWAVMGLVFGLLLPAEAGARRPIPARVVPRTG
jgi:predicted cobalt transporter CbtA